MPKAFFEEVDVLIRARYSMIYIVTWEENRARQLLHSIAAKQRKAIFEWSITDGLRRMDGQRDPKDPSAPKRQPMELLNEILQSETEAIYVLKDFHSYIDAPEVVRQLRDLSDTLRRTRKTIVFLSPQLKLPADLEKSVTIVDMPLPDYGELRSLLTEKVLAPDRAYTSKLSATEQDKMVKAALGLTYTEAENAFAKAIVRDGRLCADAIEVIAAEKRQIIRKTEVLEYYEVHDSVAGVGGMDLLKDWLRKRVRAFGEEAREYGLPQPKGILLMGVQGCGKSLVAKTIASAWQLPLLRLDMSRIYAEYIGSSEQNMRRAMTIAESIAPVVLWIDEIEKAFSGGGRSGDMDGGTSARVLGMFLTWVQEKTTPVFIVATANEVRGLPPELLRKGRLDEIFFVDLPNNAERIEIFEIHLRKIERPPAAFDLEAAAAASEGFSGAEIEQAIVSALHDSFFEDRELETRDILRSIEASVPLSTTMREKVQELRRWSVNRARPVSTAQAGTASPTSN